jgi:hypothetical protein
LPEKKDEEENLISQKKNDEEESAMLLEIQNGFISPKAELSNENFLYSIGEKSV